MYKTPKHKETSITSNYGVEGETIEQRFTRMLENNEPLGEGAPIIHTERKDGVIPGYNIRTDRFEVAIEAMDAVSKSYKAKREEAIKQRETAKLTVVKDGEPEPTQGTAEGN